MLQPQLVCIFTTVQLSSLCGRLLIPSAFSLQETNALVDRMQKELNELQPVLAAKTTDTQLLLVQVRHVACTSQYVFQS